MYQVHQLALVVFAVFVVSSCSDGSSSNKPDPINNPNPIDMTTYSLSAEVLEVAKRSGCLACHSVDKKVVGPAWRDVAQKYQDDATAVDRLVAKVKAGGKGVWGDVPMPPYSPRVPDADIALLVTSILGAASIIPPASISGTVAADTSVEHKLFLIEDTVYSLAVDVPTGNVDSSVYAVDPNGIRILVETVHSQGTSKQITLHPRASGTFIVVVTGVVASQYTLSISVFNQDQFLELAKASGCLACHSIEKKVVGPAFSDIATKYRDVADATTLLMSKVAAGGGGVWGEIETMPPYSPRVSQDDIERLVVYLLTLKPPVLTPPIVMPPPTDLGPMMELAGSSGCFTCHSIDKKIVGPAWIDVANFYRDNANAYATLFAKIKAGGKGTWGEIPMPPYSPRVSDASIAQLIADILALGGPSSSIPGTAWSVVGSVAQGETDLVSFIGDAWALYTIELETVTGDADVAVYSIDGDLTTRRLIGKSDLKQSQERVYFSTEALLENYQIEVYGVEASDYGLLVRATPLILPDPQPPSTEQFRNYIYVLNDATHNLAKASGCLACHAETTRVVGPSFKAISLRFKDVAGSKERLIAKVKVGGKGYWGEIPMPPYSPRVSDGDIDALVQSILFSDAMPTAP